MIRGSYDSADGAFLHIVVYFPAPIDRSFEISLLVDTGAARTCLSSSHLRALGVDIASIERMAPHDVSGVGGTIPGFTTRAVLAMRHEDADATLIGLQVVVLTDDGSAGLPSWLGRDVLIQGPLHFEPFDGAVYFDPPKGSIRL